MRRVLIVSPHFPPVNAPDHQRVRACLAYYREFGWDPVVLAVDPEDVQAPRDEVLGRFLPGDVEVHRVRTLPLGLTRTLGMWTLGLRALPGLAKAGGALLRSGTFDLVFFSTTQHAVTALGPAWRRRFGVPYVIDIQDPWTTSYYEDHGLRPPGGHMKHALSQWQAGALERLVLPRAGAFLSVSPGHLRRLERRGLLPAGRKVVLPFGFDPADFRRAGKAVPDGDGVLTGGGGVNWVYAGACGPVMRRALECLFQALAAARREAPERFAKCRLHFLGTSYSPDPKPSVIPVAKRCGVADLVVERPARLGYAETLAALNAADGLLLLGSDETGYSASKAASTLFAGKPVLAVVAGGTPLERMLTKVGVGMLARFDEPGALQQLAEWISSVLPQPPGQQPGWNPRVLERLTARHNARVQCEVFDAVVGAGDAKQ